MGLFSGGNSRSSTTQEQTTYNDTRNLQDNEGLTVGENSGSISVSTTDFGAVDAATDVSREALDLGRSAVDGAYDFAGRGMDNAFDFARGTNRDAMDFAGDALGTVAGLADMTRESSRELVGDTIAGFKSLAMQTSASTDDRVAKIAMYAFAAVAALVILPQIFKR